MYIAAPARFAISIQAITGAARRASAGPAATLTWEPGQEGVVDGPGSAPPALRPDRPGRDRRRRPGPALSGEGGVERVGLRIGHPRTWVRVVASGLAACLLTSPTSGGAYPIDGAAYTGIGRLAHH